MILGGIGKVVCGILIGTYGTKILSSQDAKKIYTHGTAAVLRMKDQVVKDATLIAENCADIAADAKAINEEREAAREAQLIADAEAILAQAAAKKEDEEEEKAEAAPKRKKAGAKK